MWMTTQQPPFVGSPSGSQKNPVLVIETGTFHLNVIRRTAPYSSVKSSLDIH